MKKNEQYVVIIENLGANGEGVAKIDNLTIFIPFALEGEKVKVQILKVLKNFAYAKVIEVLQPSNLRVEPKCPVFKRCGGCQLQHLDYNAQLAFKQKLVQNNLNKFGNIIVNVNNCVGSNLEYGYRNKLQLPIGEINGKVVAGFYALSSHRIIPITACPIMDNFATNLICIVLKYIDISGEKAYNTMQTGNLRHLVARCVDNKLILCLVTKSGKIKSPQILIDLLSKEFKNFSLYVNKNDSTSNVILGETFTLLYGEKELLLTNFNVEYKVSPQSFMQVNSYIQNKIYQAVLDKIDVNSVVIDAYSGAGLLSAIVSKKARQVYGIEIVPQATNNAKELAKSNNITNIKSICGDCAIELPILVQNLKNQDLTIILDPPRKGCDSKVIQSIMDVLPKKIIYISCNSATLARDLKPLMQAYKIESITPYDMFPQTCHVETLAFLVKKD